jgi:hypothetical protein
LTSVACRLILAWRPWTPPNALHIYIYTCMYMYICTDVDPHMHTCRYKYRYIHIYMYMDVCIYIYIYILFASAIRRDGARHNKNQHHQLSFVSPCRMIELIAKVTTRPSQPSQMIYICFYRFSKTQVNCDQGFPNVSYFFVPAVRPALPPALSRSRVA